MVQAKIYHATDHDIDQTLIDSDAIHIIDRLKEAGFLAYLVGGSVRDLLVKKVPKDFDISTSARPDQIKQLFQRQCLLIGRRFRLAHIRYGHKTFEVSTFRSGDNESDLIVQDNRWGTPEEDVLRRDFTINGLFFDPSNHCVIDFVGGWEDIHTRTLRTIGDPIVRFKQDPVRMIRLLKFRARFGFRIDEEAQKALIESKDEIVKSSPARILEEIFRMLESGSSHSFFQLLSESGILELLFPCLKHFLEGEHGHEIYRYLEAADKYNQKNSKRPLQRAILTSCLLFPILERELHSAYISKGNSPHMGEIMLLTASLIKGVVTSSFSHFPRRLSSTMGFILATQYRLTPMSGRRHPKPKLMHNKEFEFALQFLKLRSWVNDTLSDAYTWWKNSYYQMNKHHEHRPHLPPAHPPGQTKNDSQHASPAH